MFRVVHLNNSLGKNSGVMSFIMNYYRCIDRDKVQFDFIYFEDTTESYKNEILALGGNIFRIEYPNLWMLFNGKLNEMFRSFIDAKIIHIHVIQLTFLFAPVAHKCGLKVIIHAHSTSYSDKLFNAARNRLLCLPNRFLMDKKCACSRAAARYHFGKDKDDEVFILNNAIEHKKFGFDENKRLQIRKSLGIGNELVIGQVGRFSKEKNHKFTIQLLQCLCERGINTKLLLIGKGSLETNIKNYAKSLGVEGNVVFLGQRNDVDILLNSFDVFLLPSFFEGLGIVLIEAQSNGIPCVVSDVIPNEAKILPNYKSASLYEPIDKWADLVINAAKLARVDRANLYIEKAGFNISVEVNKLYAFYVQTLI